MKDFLQLKKNLKRDFIGLKSIKLALLGDSATQFLVQALRGSGFDYGYDLQIWEAGYNQIESQISDTNSELYAYKPELIILFQSTQNLLGRYNKNGVKQNELFAANEMASIEKMYLKLVDSLNAKVIVYNYPEIDDGVFGNYANKEPSSFLFQLRKLNYEMMLFASDHSDFHLCDISTIQNLYGRDGFFHSSMYINSDMVFSLNILPQIASKTLDLVGALKGKLRKCLILDLDNTIWGGTIGDDGIEHIEIGSLGIGKAFTQFQYWIKKLKNRGIILAVCTRNNENIAKEPFEKHPDMILKLEDIAVFVSNWGNKAENIRYIQSVLKIGYDAMVFLDDDPFERNLVRDSLPDICVPELPVDPANYLEHLNSLNLFETVSLTNEDEERTQQYQVEAKRNIVKQKFTNDSDFLESLNMLSKIETFNAFNTPRIAQLAQRSNQFNLRTIRYSEAEIEDITRSKNYFTFAFSLEDKFGDSGLICVVILKRENECTLFIDSWFMSCRVLRRGMENFVLNALVGFARNNGYSVMRGEYFATSKNDLVKDHYQNLGFSSIKDNVWLLDINHYSGRESFIRQKMP